MCGILGQITAKPFSDKELFGSMLDAIKHRGPDAEGVWTSEDQKIWLGHRRLSIIDLSELAKQPMIAGVDKTVLVFNGEIYNFQNLRKQLEDKGYHFRSHSDTEVILNGYLAWGTGVFEKLEGMFAIGLYDGKQNKIFLARDRSGEKPLFYYKGSDQFLFASELKALLKNPNAPRKLDKLAWDVVLAYGYVPGDLCILEGYKKLDPANVLEYDLTTGKTKIWRYWQMPELSKVIKSKDELQTQLHELLKASVSRQLVADVPVGVLLSGGLDSSIVTALAASCRSDIKTFTVSFPGAGSMDESAHAKLIASHFGTTHLQLEASNASFEDLPKLAEQVDEPMTDPSIIPTFQVAQLIRQYCTVALGGDGADELFGGYHRYQRMLQLQQRVGKIPSFIRKILDVSATNILPQGFKGRYSLQEMGADFSNGLPMLPNLFEYSFRKTLSPISPNGQLAEAFMQQRVIPNENIAERSMRTDFNNYMTDDILVKSDRASMLASLEIRAPFLDVPVIDFAFQEVPAHLKTTLSERKILLKSLAKQMLPPSFDFDRKQGFVPPLELWFKEKKWQEFLFGALVETKNPLFDRAAIAELWKGQEKGRFNKRRLFALLMIQLWQQRYNIEC